MSKLVLLDLTRQVQKKALRLAATTVIFDFIEAALNRFLRL